MLRLASDRLRFPVTSVTASPGPDRTMSSMSMYERALGERFMRLDRSVRRFHRLSGRHALEGWVETDAPTSLFGVLFALCLGTPRKAARGPLRLEIDAQPDVEVLTRRFPSQTMTSRVAVADGLIVEQLGPARLTFQAVETVGTLELRLVRLHMFGIPCPRWLTPQVIAEETGYEDQLQFRVEASLRSGVVARYRGHLQVPSEGLPS